MFLKRYKSAFLILFVLSVLVGALHTVEHSQHQDDCQVCIVSQHSSALLPEQFRLPLVSCAHEAPRSYPPLYRTLLFSSAKRERAPPPCFLA